MGLPTIRSATPDERDRVLQTITIGFSADPVGRWLWPEAADYLSYMRRFSDAFGGAAIDNGSAYIANNFAAAALWLAPGTDPDGDTIEQILGESIKDEIGEDVEKFFAAMDDYHPHDEPCWYLPLIAADPAYIGQGLGAALMKHALDRCDNEGVTAYLESSNPRNITLYERHGFEVMGEIQVGASPVMTPMIRQAQKK